MRKFVESAGPVPVGGVPCCLTLAMYSLPAARVGAALSCCERKGWCSAEGGAVQRVPRQAVRLRRGCSTAGRRAGARRGAVQADAAECRVQRELSPYVRQRRILQEARTRRQVALLGGDKLPQRGVGAVVGHVHGALVRHHITA